MARLVAMPDKQCNNNNIIVFVLCVGGHFVDFLLIVSSCK